MSARALIILCLLLSFAIAATGCGGGQSGSGDKGGGEQVEKAGGNNPKLTTVSGTLGRIDTEKGIITLRPEQGEEPLQFRFNPDNPKALKVRVEGKEASLGELSGGQKAEVGYFERNDRKVARSIKVQGQDLATVNGTLGVVDPEKGRLTLRTEAGTEPLRFRLLDRTQVKVGGREASPGELSGGQKAEVGYFERNDRKVATTVSVQSEG